MVLLSEAEEEEKGRELYAGTKCLGHGEKSAESRN